jgi:hypothetical protein
MPIADIHTEARSLVDATTASYIDSLLLIRTNMNVRKVSDAILACDGKFQWDDANNTDYPNGVAIIQNLVSGQQAYPVDTSLVKFAGAAIKNQSGIWRKLLPFDPETDLTNSSTPLTFIPLTNFGPTMDRAEFLKTPGAPQFVDVTGSSAVLYPAPDNGISVTLLNGLKIYGQRLGQPFTSAEVATGTKQPGFAAQFHHIIAYLDALPYAQAYKPERVATLQAEILRIMGDPDRGVTGALTRFYTKRNKDDRPVMRGKKIRFI